MAMEVKVIIEYIPSEHGSIDYANIVAPAQSSLSNISEISTAHVGARPFIVGASIVGNGDTMWSRQEKFNGFMGSQRNFGADNSFLIDKNGNPTQPPILKIVGENIDHLIINFDSTAQQWATELIINGITYKNNDASFLWANPTPIPSVEIRITKWNKPLFPVRITSILIGLTIEYDKSQIENLSVTSETNNNPNTYATGTMSQFSNFTLLDYDMNIFELAQLKIIKPDMKTTIYFGDKKIAEMGTEKFRYSYGSSLVGVALKDTILRWNNIFFAGIANNVNNTAETFFNGLESTAGESIYISDETRQYLKDINTDGFLPAGNFRERMNEFLAVVGMKIYPDSNGNPKGVLI